MPIAVRATPQTAAKTMSPELSIKAGITKEQILFVVMKVPESGDKEAMATKNSILDWGFNVVPSWMPFRTTYGKAMDSGYSMSETRYSTLNERAGSILTAIADKTNKEVTCG